MLSTVTARSACSVRLAEQQRAGPASQRTAFLAAPVSRGLTGGGCKSAGLRPATYRTVTKALFTKSGPKTGGTQSVSDTKAAFVNAYRYPINPLYNVVLQELLVQLHLIRFNSMYAYDPLAALGFVAVYDQLMEGFEPAGDKEAIFKAFVTALKESPEQYRADATRLSGLPAQTAEALANLPEVQSVAARKAAGKLTYSKFLAIGLFTLLDAVAGGADKNKLTALATAAGLDMMIINRDLSVYKSLLSKLAASRELMNETLSRERKKAEERLAKKTASA